MPRALVHSLLLAAPLLLPALLWLPAGCGGPEGGGDREEVLFWHFWGGEDRGVVEEVVARFNGSQERWRVRAIAMPGNNLDLKLFLAVAGGDPPDLINQDDPILADWASRGALTPLAELASPEELEALRRWLRPAARRLAEFNGEPYGLCNGLDIRALYCNETLLAEQGLQPPKTLAELDHLAFTLTPPESVRAGLPERFGYLPDSRRLWAWGIVFGGAFYDPVEGRATPDHPRVAAALEWMTEYRRRYGARALAAFRHGDQSLPGKTFPLLARRYAVMMDGQWRVRDLAAYQAARAAAGEPADRFAVVPLPPPPGGLPDAGWVNGNLFLVPRGARQPAGAWAFMKFWSGFGGFEGEAAATCAAGGWIPVSPAVAEHPTFERYLEENPLMREFIRLSGSENQHPTPVIPGAPRLYRSVLDAAERSLLSDSPPEPSALLEEAGKRISD